MMSYVKNSRNFSVDFLRGVSILLVVLMHFSTFMPGGVFLSTSPLSGEHFHILGRNGYYGVCIFFAISGFLITSRLIDRSQGKLKNIVLSEFYFFRISRLFPAIILLCCINVLFFYLSISGFETSFASYTLKDLLTYLFTFRFNLLYMQGGNGLLAWAVLWSLAIEEVFYLFYPFVCIVSRSFFVLFVLLLFLVFYGMWYRYSSGTFAGNLSYLGCFDQMAFGCIAALLVRNNWVQKQKSILYSIAIFAGLALMTYTYCRAEVHEDAVYGPTLMALGTFLYLLGCGKNEKKNTNFWLKLKNIFVTLMSPIAILGVLSYELYLFHMVLFLFIKPLLVALCVQWKIQTLYFFVLILLVLILLVILNGLLYFYCFEPIRIKIRNITHRWVPYTTFSFLKEFLMKCRKKTPDSALS